MATVCRLCGNNELQAIFIFGNEGIKHHIDLKIRVGLDIQIFPDDPLPKHACVCCLHKLDEFWTFLHQCRRVQTNLRRLLPERVPFHFQNTNSDRHHNCKTVTEESSAHIEVLETLGDPTDNDANNPGNLNSNNNYKLEVDEVKIETHSNDNSNDSFRSYNEFSGKECDPCGKDPNLNDTGLLVATQNGTSLSVGQLDSFCQVKEDNMAITAAVYTSESALEGNPVRVKGESEVQASLVRDTNTVLRRCGTGLSVNNNNVNSHSFSDRSQDSLLMEGQTLKVPNTFLLTTSCLTGAEQATEDKNCNEVLAVNNDLNPNALQAPNIISESSHYLPHANKGHHETKSSDTCGCMNNMSDSLLLMEEQTSKNESDVTHDTQDISAEVVNSTRKEKEVNYHSVNNNVRHTLLKEEVACKTTIHATDTCSQRITVREVPDGEISKGDAFQSFHKSVIIKDLSLTHPNNIGIGRTNVSSVIVASENGTSSDGNLRKSLKKVHISDVTEKVTKNTQYYLNVSTKVDGQTLQVMHSNAETAVIQVQHMEPSDLQHSIGLTSENEVYQHLQLNPPTRSDSNTSFENKEYSVIVNSGKSDMCDHGIDARLCIYKLCCDSHPLDSYWNKMGTRFHCMLCEYFTVSTDKIRRHINAHVSLNVFECSICNKKLRSYRTLSVHMKIHSRQDDMGSTSVRDVYSCENCSKTFNSKTYFRYHQMKICGIGSVSCPDCGLRFSSLKIHKFSCPGLTGFVCDICDKSYKTKGEIRQHLRTHERGEYACDKCHKCFSTSFRLKLHQKNVHETGEFKCTYCTKSFYYKHLLEKHVVRHTGIRNFLCEICSKSFLTSGNLSSHMKFHGKRDIECHLCGKMYFRKNMMVYHMKKVHFK